MRTPGGLHTSLSALFLFFFSFHNNNNKKDIFLIDVWKQSSLSLSLSFSWFFASSLAGWRPLSPPRIPKNDEALTHVHFVCFVVASRARVLHIYCGVSLSFSALEIKKNDNEDDVSVSRKWRRQWGPSPFAASPPAGSHCSFVLAYLTHMFLVLTWYSDVKVSFFFFGCVLLLEYATVYIIKGFEVCV